ncbi:MAG: CAP domain-containing protein, partial [Eubacteriales bacterium]|nr:CAP domain-containing protein [Eubacteriales bacterium]
EMKAFNEINAERTKNGLSPLTWNEGLYAGAKIRAQEHYEFIDLGIGAGPHKRKNGDDFYTAVTETSNYSFSSFCVWGENCGGNSNSGDFVNGWMNSSAHKANMLDGEYSQMAVAIIFARSTYYASCIFVG